MDNLSSTGRTNIEQLASAEVSEAVQNLLDMIDETVSGTAIESDNFFCKFLVSNLFSN